VASLDWLATVRLAIPRLPAILRRLRPTYHLPDGGAVDEAFLRREGIRGVIWDVDGTLMSYHALEIAPTLRSHLEPLLGSSDIRHVILSNCGEARFRTLGTIFPNLPVVRAYTTPAGPVFRHLLRGRDTHSEAELRALLATGARHIRKPHRLPVEYAIRLMDGVDRGSALMVGDQYFTDVASANLAGVRSAKVPTLAPETFPKAIRATQHLEALAYHLFYRRA